MGRGLDSGWMSERVGLDRWNVLELLLFSR